MLFPLMMALLFVAPLFGYYWLWTRNDTPLQRVPDVGSVIFALLVSYGILYFAGILAQYYYTYYCWVMFLLWGIFGPIALAIYLHFAKQAPPQKHKEMSRPKLIQILMIGLLLVSNLAPMIGYSVNTSYCFYKSQDEAESLVLALEAYHGDHNQFPTRFTQLTGEYLESMPKRACTSPEWDGCEETWDSRDYTSPISLLNGGGTTEIYVLAWFLENIGYMCMGGLS